MSKSARFLAFFIPLIALLFNGSAPTAARRTPAYLRPHIRSQIRGVETVDGVELPGPGAPFSPSRAPHAAGPALPSTHAIASPGPVTLASAGDVVYPAFALEVHPGEELVKIPDTSAPGTWDSIASTPDTDYLAGDFLGRDYGQLYVLDLTSNELHALDTATGADNTIGPSIPVSGQMWTGATGAAEGALYASSADGTASYLYEIDTATGAATVLGEIAGAPCIIDIAINAGGEMYGVDTCSDVLVGIDPATAGGTVVGPLGFDADYAQGMDFEDRTGVLYLAAYNATLSRGELRIADTGTGNSVLIGPFPDGAEVDALAFAAPTTAPVQVLQNPGFEGNWAHWQTEGYPSLSSTSHGGSLSAKFFGEEVWAWQPVFIPGDATDVRMSYWLTGLSAEFDWDSDILCGGLWDLARQKQLAGGCFDLHYFYSYPMEWKARTYTLDAEELSSVAGKAVLLGFQEEQDWMSGYSKTSTAWVDDVTLYVTRPVYEYQLFLPLVVRGR